MKLYIVEDENLNREFLLDLPWSEIGAEICGSAENGQEAWEEITRFRPDIVLSDIRMPVRDGIWLAEKISMLMQTVKVIFFTGYHEFEYAQKAIQYGVSQYVTKPIRKDELFRIVSEVISQLKNEQKTAEDTQHLKEQLEGSSVFLKDLFMSSVLRQDFSAIASLPMYEALSAGRYFAAVSVSLFSTSKHYPELHHFELFKKLNSVLGCKDRCVIPFFSGSTFSYIACFGKDSSPASALNATIGMTDLIQEFLELNYNADFIIGIGQIVSCSGDIPLSCRGAESALKYNFYLGNNKAIYINDVETVNRTPTDRLADGDTFSNAIKVGDRSAALQIIRRLIEELKQSQTELETIQQICFEVILYIFRALHEAGHNSPAFFSELNPLTLMQNANTLDALAEILMQTVDRAVSVIAQDRETKNTAIIQNVKQLIKEHLSENLSLNDIAQQVHFSPCYLSSIFKNATNMTFKDYVLDLKIAKAKELLKNTDYKIYEISSMIGYENSKYFSSLFHKATGQMPSMYRYHSKAKNLDAIKQTPKG